MLDQALDVCSQVDLVWSTAMKLWFLFSWGKDNEPISSHILGRVTQLFKVSFNLPCVLSLVGSSLVLHACLPPCFNRWWCRSEQLMPGSIDVGIAWCMKMYQSSSLWEFVTSPGLLTWAPRAKWGEVLNDKEDCYWNCQGVGQFLCLLKNVFPWVLDILFMRNFLLDVWRFSF